MGVIFLINVFTLLISQVNTIFFNLGGDLCCGGLLSGGYGSNYGGYGDNYGGYGGNYGGYNSNYGGYNVNVNYGAGYVSGYNYGYGGSNYAAQPKYRIIVRTKYYRPIIERKTYKLEHVAQAQSHYAQPQPHYSQAQPQYSQDQLQYSQPQPPAPPPIEVMRSSYSESAHPPAIPPPQYAYALQSIP